MKRLLLSREIRPVKMAVLIIAMVSSLLSSAQVTNIRAVADAKKIGGIADRCIFIENKGQWPNTVLFLTTIGSMNAWITKNGIVYDFFSIKNNTNDNLTGFLYETPYESEENNIKRYGQVIYMSLIGVNANSAPVCEDVTPTYFNYFIGNDMDKWVGSVKTCKEATVKNIYDKIDIRYYFEHGNLRFDYIVQPGGDLTKIKFVLTGSEDYYISEKGDLAFLTRFGEVKFEGLTTYQLINGKKKILPSRFVLTEDDVCYFSVDGFYDKNLPVFIDPIIYSTFLGGTILEEGNAITNDSAGYTYVAGSTGSNDFPTTAGSYDETAGYGIFCFVSKINTTGSELVYSTYIGGDLSTSHCLSIALDKQGNIFLTGDSDSTSFPTTLGSYSNSSQGMVDMFVAKLNAAGNTLLYSSRFGGDNYDYSKSIALDTAGNAYITGTTYSSNLPTTISGFDTSNSGSSDAFIIKLNESGNNLIYSTYIGGASHDISYSIALDKFNNAYITGWTLSDDFPVVQGSYDLNRNTYDSDIYVTKINALGDSLLYSTFIGDSSADYAYSIAVDDFQNAYIGGGTFCGPQLTGYPTTPGCYDESRNGAQDIVVTKLNAAGNALEYSTLIGGAENDYAWAICLDNAGKAHITGWTESSDFPTTVDGFDQTLTGSRDSFVTSLSIDGDSLSFSSFLGGGNKEDGFDISIDDSNFVYVTGRTCSSNFPVTSGCLDPSYGSSSEKAFITKIALNAFSNSYESIESSEIAIYPNPSNSLVNITFACPFSGILNIIDITGKIVYTESIKEKMNKQFSVENFPKGVFMVSLIDSAGACIKQKLIVL